MSRHRSSSKRAPPEIGLHMECVEEELEASQINFYTKAEKEFNEVQNKLDNYVKKMRAEVVEKGENCLVLQLNATPTVSLGSGQISTSSAVGKSTRHSVQGAQNYQQMVGQGILTRSTAGSAGNTYLVMDSRLGFMTINPSHKTSQRQSPNISNDQNVTPPKTTPGGRGRQSSAASVPVTTRAKSLKKLASANESEIIVPPTTRTRDKVKVQSTSPQTSQIIQQQQIFSTVSTPVSGNYKLKVNAKPLPISSKPGENNAVGGLLAGNKIPWKPNNDDLNRNSPDSREVVFNKAAGKTFPSLVVVARPHLKVKYIHQINITQERTALDAKVKGVLMYSSTKFIEWLIQQGLIKSEQTCQTHVNNDMSPVKLKLGMYSDVSKFPYSGGYVWISDCCPAQFVSVFSGSIFEGAPHPPTTLLKLIYHWACQTNVQNVVQWVKVDNLYLKNFYMNMRAVCTQAVQEKYKKMGGPRKKIEVGVISLGTTSQDGCRRQVKVEVLGVMDQESKLVRLRAVEPLSDERSFKRRFIKILEPLEDWVNKDSTILTDFTVAKAALYSMGFHTVFQVTNESKYSNQNIMEYLRRIVPRMFQNTLSLLSRQIIQQFLDELVWREMWGPIPSQAFVNIVAHIAEQTKMDVGDNLLTRLNKVASNPLKRWDYSVWKPVTNTRNASKAQQRPSTSQDIGSEGTSESPETPAPLKGIRTRKRAAEQATIEIPTSPARKLSKVSAKEKVKKEEKPGKKDKETSDKLPEDFLKFLNEGQQISLTKYYYGFLNVNDCRDNICKGHFNVKCGVCNKRFTNNIVLMKHMILHCQTQPALAADLKSVHQCESCLLGFNASSALTAHLEEIHCITDGKVQLNLLCHICEEKFKNRSDLIYHMYRTHVQLELPYECGVCHFRTSLYRHFVQHFIKTHNKEEHIFCPYCLKVVMLSYKGKAIESNVLFYMSHLEKHQRLALVKDCYRCQLSFIHKGILDQHLEADHGSWKDESGVQQMPHLPEGISMPEPGSNVIKYVSPIKPPKFSKMKHLFTTNKFKTLEINGVGENMACIECEGSISRSEHFTGSFNCLKCRFASCCERAMAEHVVIFHETSPPQFTKGKPIFLAQEMFCVCGYSSIFGNRLAKHLALCEKKSAYVSEESALAAAQSSFSEDPKKHGESQNMLNMLGLVRKSPESTTVVMDNESMKREMDHEALGETEMKEENQMSESLEVLPRTENEMNMSEQKIPMVDSSTTDQEKDLKEKAVDELVEVEDKTNSEEINLRDSNLNSEEEKDLEPSEENIEDRKFSEETLKNVKDEKKTELVQAEEEEEMKTSKKDDFGPDAQAASDSEEKTETEYVRLEDENKREKSEDYEEKGNEVLPESDENVEDELADGSSAEKEKDEAAAKVTNKGNQQSQ